MSKRRGPSDDWPRVYIELIPPEVEREGLDAFDIIGQDTRGVLERRPASCVFVEVVLKKFVRKADKQALETSVFIADAGKWSVNRHQASSEHRHQEIRAWTVLGCDRSAEGEARLDVDEDGPGARIKENSRPRLNAERVEGIHTRREEDLASGLDRPSP